VEKASDHELIDRFLAGDARAYEAIVRRHWTEVIALASRWLGADASAAAEDVAVDVFVALHKHLPEWRGDGALRTWLYRATLNKSGNWRQAQHRRKRASERLPGAKSKKPVTAPHEKVQGREDSRRLRRALESLPARERAVMILFHYQHLKPQTIARVLGTSLSTVKRALRTSLDTLKRILLSDG
jgi:RNA polymerase sigma-70 factor (ECF subfamily)